MVSRGQVFRKLSSFLDSVIWWYIRVKKARWDSWYVNCLRSWKYCAKQVFLFKWFGLLPVHESLWLCQWPLSFTEQSSGVSCWHAWKSALCSGCLPLSRTVYDWRREEQWWSKHFFKHILLLHCCSEYFLLLHIHPLGCS